jgi:hypothetical protein
MSGANPEFQRLVSGMDVSFFRECPLPRVFCNSKLLLVVFSVVFSAVCGAC